MTSSMNSFPPSTIVLIVVLNEAIENKELEPNSPILDFLLENMIDLGNLRWENFSDFERDLVRAVPSAGFIIRLKEKFSLFRNFNDLYKYLMSSLKNIRIFNTKPDSLGNNKSEQGGHVLDLFVRRILLNFNRLTFSDIIKVYDQFKLFLTNKMKASAQSSSGNEAAMQKLYNSLNKFSHLYNDDEVQEELRRLETPNQNSKIFRLKSMCESNNGNFMQAIDYLHKYFDKNLRFLNNKDKSEGAINKIGHSVLNFAYMTLKHGYYDEALRAIAETLRIAQNNADEESINHSLIYLYNIAGILGLYKDEILLAEHAITHSLNLNNPILMLYSSLSYAQLERHYDCSYKSRDLLKTRNISWTSALNFASKKLYSHFEQLSLMNRIRDPFEELAVPKTYQKLVKALMFETISEPKMVSLYINSIFEQNPQLLFTNEAIEVMLEIAYNALNWDPMKSLEILRMYKNNIKRYDESKYSFFLLILCLCLSLNRNEFQTALYIEKVLFDMFEKGNTDPNLISIAWGLKNKRLIKQEDYTEAYQSCLCLIEYNKKRGYVKDKLLVEYLNLATVFSRTGDYISALEQVEFCIRATKKFKSSIKYHAKMFKAYLLCHIEKERSALRILQKMETKGINDLSARLVAYYNYVKAYVLCSLSSSSESELRHQIVTDCQTYLNRALEIYINLGYLEEIREIYYIQSRLYYDLDLYKYRETASQYFALADNLLGFFSQFNEVSQLCLNDSRLLHLQETVLIKISDEFRVITPCNYTN